MSVNAQVVSFAQSRMGNRVGRRGECWDLAEEALRSAGARSSRDLGSVGSDTVYVWGTLIPVGSLQAGDIVQFRNYQMTVRTTTTNSEGSSWTEQTQSRPHHTAIVAAVGSDGAIEVFEQNVGGRRVVMRNSLYFQSARQERRSGGSTIVTQVTVSGSLWFYRPQARTVQER